jgi:integrase
MAWLREQPNGKWLVQWREPDGRKRSRAVATYEEAIALKAHEESAARAHRVLRDVPGLPGWEDENHTIGAAFEPEYALDAYLHRIVEQDTELRQSVRDTYLSTVRHHIDGTPLGRADIRTITPDDVTTFWAGIERNRRSVYGMLAKAFNAAVRAGVLESSPLMRAGIKKPRANIRAEERVLTVAELERLADGAAHPRARMAILLMGFCGLRAGEVAGLRVQDVSFRPRCRLSIRQAVVQSDGKRYISPPKTQAARRTISVAGSVIDELKAYIEEFPPAPDGRIFHRGNGELIGNSSINASVKWAAHRAGLPDTIHSHQLRHTAVSLLIDDGANAKQIQVYVGHANITETLQTYGHLLDQAGDALAASMERRREAHRNGGV